MNRAFAVWIDRLVLWRIQRRLRSAKGFWPPPSRNAGRVQGQAGTSLRPRTPARGRPFAVDADLLDQAQEAGSPPAPEAEEFYRCDGMDLALLAEEKEAFREASSWSRRRLVFQSPLPSLHPENERLPVWLYQPRHDARGAMILLHGWKDYKNLFQRRVAKELATAGLASMVVELPYHFSRTPPGRRHGDLFFYPDPLPGLGSLRRAVIEVRLLARWWKAQQTDGTRLGIMGSSLGGLIAALCICVDSVFSCAILNEPAADLPFLADHTRLGQTLRGLLMGKDAQRGPERLATLITPRLLKPRLPAEKILIIESLYDQFVPNACVEALWEAWERPPLLRHGHSHISVFLFGSRKIAREIRRLSGHASP